jgi:hypothetical protein
VRISYTRWNHPAAASPTTATHRRQSYTHDPGCGIRPETSATEAVDSRRMVCWVRVAEQPGHEPHAALGQGHPTSDHGRSELARLSPSPGAVSVPIVPVTAHTVVLRNSSHHSPRSVSAVLLRACAHRDRSNGFPELTSPATIRAHAQDPGDPRARRPAPSPNRLGYPCTFQDRHDRLRLRVTRLFPQCHQAGPEHCAQRGGHWRPGLRTFRWATARPDPAADHWNPQRGLGG